MASSLFLQGYASLPLFVSLFFLRLPCSWLIVGVRLRIPLDGIGLFRVGVRILPNIKSEFELIMSFLSPLLPLLLGVHVLRCPRKRRKEFTSLRCIAFSRHSLHMAISPPSLDMHVQTRKQNCPLVICFKRRQGRCQAVWGSRSKYMKGIAAPPPALS